MRRPTSPVVRAAVAAAALVLASGCRPSRGGAAAQGGIAVSHVVMPVPASRAEAAVFMVIENRSGAPLTLTGGSSPDAETLRLHREIGGLMEPVPGIEIPAGGRVRLVPGGYHLMLENVGRALSVGDTVILHLDFEPGVSLTVKVPLLTYTDAVSDLPMR